MTLLDQTAPISFVLQVGDDGTLEGSAVVKQSNWGIKPYSALFGALRVADKVEVAIDTGLKPRVEVPLPGYERIRPRQLKPALLELEGISRTSVIAHHKLYQGYVAKRNEILARLAGLGRANDPELRALKVELSYAVGAIKNHEVYFEHLGGEGGEPTGAIGDLITRDFGSVGAWRADLRATALAGRGWAWTAYDWERGSPLQLPRGRRERLAELERHASRRPRRPRARVLPRFPDRPRRLRRRVLRQPGLGRRERLDRGLRDRSVPVDGLRVEPALDPGRQRTAAVRVEGDLLDRLDLRGIGAARRSIQAPLSHLRSSGDVSSAAAREQLALGANLLRRRR